RTRTVAARSFRRGSVLVAIHPLHAFPLRAGETGAPDAAPRTTDAGGSAAADTGSDIGRVGPATRCAQCFGGLPPRRPRCSGCRQTEYCSMACLTRHWAARHHFECGQLDARAVDMAAARIKPEFRPCLRMAAGISAAVAGPAPAEGPRWLRVQRAAWSRLVSHRERHPGYVLRQYGEIARLIAAQTAATGGRLPGTEDGIITALCRSGCNNFAASEPHGGRTAGHLCSPFVSLLLNHSCLPNAAFAYSPVSGRQVVQAFSDIAEGDEVTLSYADGLLPRSERRKLLESVYFFECSCAKCTGNGARAQIDALLDRAPDSVDQVPDRLPTDYAIPPAVEPWVARVLELLAAAIGDGSAPCTGDSQLERSLLDAVADELPRNVSFAAYRHWLECQDECLERIAAGQPEVHAWACTAAMYVLAFYVLAYPPHYPLVGRQCLDAAKLAWNMLQLSAPSPGPAHGAVATASRARVLARCAQQILAVSADPDASPSQAQQQAALLLSELDSLAASTAALGS
ncbi:hypothetical protein H4R19_005961, partial [Coemansia spiralis]